MTDLRPVEPPETVSYGHEIADILKSLGCACTNRIESRCGRSAAQLFVGVDTEGRTFNDMCLSLGLPPQEARALLELARIEVVATLCLTLARPSEQPAAQRSASGGCACPRN